jgi:hypothetical protein
VLNIPTCTLLASSSKICRLFLILFWSAKIAWLCGSMCFSNFYFLSQNSKLVHSLNHFHLRPMQGNGVVYLTVLAPIHPLVALFYPSDKPHEPSCHEPKYVHKCPQYLQYTSIAHLTHVSF